MNHEFSIEKAASISFVIHIIFFLIAGITTSHKPVIEDSVYAVSLISPEVADSHLPSGGGDTQGSAKKSARRVPPPKSTTSDIVTYDTDAIEAKTRAIQKARASRTQRRAELREQKETSEYAEKQLEDMKSKSKLDAIRRSAQRSAAATGAQGLTKTQKSERLAQYTALVRDKIRSNWVFTETETSGRLLIEVLVNIRATGIIDIVKITRASGNRPFDQSVIKAIRKTREVEPPPFGEKLTGVTLGFTPEDM
jgi:TonB family protein